MHRLLKTVLLLADVILGTWEASAPAVMLETDGMVMEPW